MIFAELLERFREELNRRLNNGEFTERGLASKTGISQPHLHHILKGKRALRPEVADRLLAELRIEIRDLL